MNVIGTTDYVALRCFIQGPVEALVLADHYEITKEELNTSGTDQGIPDSHYGAPQSGASYQWSV